MIQLPEWIIPVKELVVDKRVRGYCGKKYPNHPKGCPNIGKKDTCPPKAPMIEDFMDINRPMWLVVERFDLLAQERRMLEKHPGWSKRQARNCLYWQSLNRKKCRIKADEALEILGADIWTMCPEAMGVHVYETGAKSGIIYEEIADMQFVTRTALVGFRNGD